MKTEDLLRLAYRNMEAVNEVHRAEVISSMVLDLDELEIRFDIMPSVGMSHICQICDLLNLTLFMKGEDDRIQYALLP